MNYRDFVESKRLKIEPSGFEPPNGLNEHMFPFQADIVRWALRRGKSAMFEDCGLGKTLQELVWAQCVVEHTNKPVLIFTPLAVGKQTVREADKFGIDDVRVVAHQDEVKPGINISNYEKLHHFDPLGFGGLVLDESSILKGLDGKYRKQLNEFAIPIGYRLSATATPAPNDFTELLRQAEFLGVMNETEIKALYFTQDGNSTQKWRLKRHAENEFWQFMAQWSIALRKPSDLNYDDNGFILPDLSIEQITVESDVSFGNMLFPVEAQTLQERREARRASLPDRVAKCAEMINADDEMHIVWCDLNAESEALTSAINGAVEVKGSQKTEVKEDRLMAFSNGDIRVLVSKPTIAGHGMNWQHCNNMSFVGLSDSYEQQYQAIRRCWRFGQNKPVNVTMITSELEGAVVENVKRKEKQSTELMERIVANMSIYSEVSQSRRHQLEYNPQVEMTIPKWLKEQN